MSRKQGYPKRFLLLLVTCARPSRVHSSQYYLGLSPHSDPVDFPPFYVAEGPGTVYCEEVAKSPGIRSGASYWLACWNKEVRPHREVIQVLSEHIHEVFWVSGHVLAAAGDG